jgi:hypothetical protein
MTAAQITTSFVLPLLLLCSALTYVQSSRIEEIMANAKGGGGRNGYGFEEDGVCTSTSSKRSCSFSGSSPQRASTQHHGSSYIFHLLAVLPAIDVRQPELRQQWDMPG